MLHYKSSNVNEFHLQTAPGFIAAFSKFYFSRNINKSVHLIEYLASWRKAWTFICAYIILTGGFLATLMNYVYLCPYILDCSQIPYAILVYFGPSTQSNKKYLNLIKLF